MLDLSALTGYKTDDRVSMDGGFLPAPCQRLQQHVSAFVETQADALLMHGAKPKDKGLRRGVNRQARNDL